MVLYMGVFTVLACLSFLELFHSFSNSVKKIVVIMFSVIFIILSTIYNGNMGDFISYQEYFNSLSLLNLIEAESNLYEYLYTFLNVIVGVFVKNYTMIRFFLALIVMSIWYFLYVGDKKADNIEYPITTILVLWALNFGNIFIIRSTISVSICAFSLRYIKKKDLKKFLITTLIACGFHTMSILWIPAYYIYHKSVWRKFYYCIIFFLLLIPNMIKNIVLWVGDHMGSYIRHKVFTYIGYGEITAGVNYSILFITIKALANVMILLLIFNYIIYRKKKKKTLRDEEGYLNLYLVGTIIYIMSLGSSLILARAALTYNCVQYFLLPKIFQLPEIKKSVTLKIAVFLLFATYLFLRFYLNIKSSNYIPFTTVFG